MSINMAAGLAYLCDFAQHPWWSQREIPSLHLREIG